MLLTREEKLQIYCPILKIIYMVFKMHRLACSILLLHRQSIISWVRISCFMLDGGSSPPELDRSSTSSTKNRAAEQVSKKRHSVARG